ncbi:uncharacterized protein [Populus alba]|uniref:DUF3067 domain-containing protein n=2 Tax=Populus TaxID=3689 RepID=A0A4U5MYG7_POPAL|nr:uncharacterized protein LOC118043055 [Populus alba]KAJ6982704.1 hypothetical protein NC653_025727 [Populus alba x Populus x berolinensis]TKR74442.1 hypothetical protein D5086_0000294750 [Populus alba]
MSSIVSGHHCNWSLGGAGVQEHFLCRGRFYSNKVPCPGDNHSLPCRGLVFSTPQSLASSSCYRPSTRKYRPVLSSTVDDPRDQDDPEEDGAGDKDSSKGETGGIDSELLRENLERIVGSDDSAFSGIDLATLIRNKYGRSYDVQLIKKEFMGRNLLALNVMWKYREQRSFPLTEEEYILRLDDVANTLKCWGAVSHIRNSLEKSKERPRIGKAVSIFIDMDESGGRANEWIYK